MFGADVLVRKALSLFGRIGQHALALVAQRKIDRSGNLFTDGGVAFDLFADRFHRRVRAQKTVGQGLIFAQQSEQQVFSLYIRRTELAGLIPRKKDDAPGFLRVAFKHKPNPPEFLRNARSAEPLTLLHYAFIPPYVPSDTRLVVTPYVLPSDASISSRIDWSISLNRGSILPFVTPEATPEQPP